MRYEVATREISSITAMGIRFLTSMDSIVSAMGESYEELWNYLEKNGAVTTGQCFAIYHDPSFDPDRMDVECCFSVQDLVPDGGRVKGRLVEGGLMATAVHKGPYEGMEAAYRAIMDWCGENGYALLTGWRDNYLNDPAKVSPMELLTEIYCPVKKIA